jgi:hypothetical protein
MTEAQRATDRATDRQRVDFFSPSVMGTIQAEGPMGHAGAGVLPMASAAKATGNREEPVGIRFPSGTELDKRAEGPEPNRSHRQHVAAPLPHSKRIEVPFRNRKGQQRQQPPSSAMRL